MELHECVRFATVTVRVLVLLPKLAGTVTPTYKATTSVQIHRAKGRIGCTCTLPFTGESPGEDRSMGLLGRYVRDYLTFLSATRY